MTDRRTVRVLVADDAAEVRTTLRATLERTPTSSNEQIEVVGEAATGDDAARLAMQLRPDVVILSARISGIGSVAATRRIRAAGAAAGVLVHAANADDPWVDDALRSGGCVFVPSAMSPTGLAAMVREAARGTGSVEPRLRQMPARPMAVQLPSPLDALMPREVEILRLLGRGKSDKQIAATLGLTTSSVRTAVAGVLRKLKVADRAQAVHVATTHGLA